MHRKLAPRPEPRSDSLRPLTATQVSHRPAYARVLELVRARAVSVAAVLAIAPLGAFLGTVSACGGAAPTQPETLDAGPDSSASTRALPAPTISASEAAPATPSSVPAPAASTAPPDEP